MARCISCFGPVAEGNRLCDNCARIARSEIALPLGAQLQHGRYAIGRTLGDPGGFGVTYLAWDTSLERRVAIKEFFPRHLVNRGPGQSSPALSSQAVRLEYEAGLKGFLDEARRLAGLDHPNIVKVHDYCEAFETGYLVMSYYEGHDLKQHTERAGGMLGWQEAVNLVLPLLDGLAEVHRIGLIHRDIKPANTYLANRADGKVVPILIDFGAARWTTTTKELTAILTEGFAPLEQYPDCGPQGAFTDIYAAAATLYAVIAGKSPPSAPSRLTSAYLPHLTDQVPGVPRRLGDAVDQALSIQAEDRPQSAAEFARMLRAASPASRPATTGPVRAESPSQFAGDDSPTRIAPTPSMVNQTTAPIVNTVPPTKPAADSKSNPMAKVAIAAAVIVVIAGAILVPKMFSGPNAGPPAAPGPTKPESSAVISQQLEKDAMQQFDLARAGLDAGDYPAAMKAAGALHTLSVRTDWPGQARFGWGTRADSIAGAIVTACPADPGRARDKSAPPCPARSW